MRSNLVFCARPWASACSRGVIITVAAVRPAPAVLKKSRRSSVLALFMVGMVGMVGMMRFLS
jgi:hypothetical protein